MRARVRTFRDLEEIKQQIAEIYVEDEAIGIMAPKALHFSLLIEDIRAPVAIIIKEALLSAGGDAAIHREAITGKIDRSTVLIMGTLKQLRKLISNLKRQPFGCDELAAEIRSAIDNFYKIPSPWKLPDGKQITFEKTRIMGIINVTTDSFGGDGVGDDIQKALELAKGMEANGADFIDIGGESTRPGAEAIDDRREMERVLPIIEKLVDRIKIPISIDSRKPKVVKAALEAGASIVNDVTGLSNGEMVALCAEEKVPVIAMHMKGEPKTMQDDPIYEDVVGEIMHFLADNIRNAVEGGIAEEQIAIDPGIGFGKRLEDNLELIRRLSEFKTLGLPIAIGLSRKAFIGKITGLPVDQRLEGSIGAASIAALNGANIIRCHDVRETKLALQVADSIKTNRSIEE